MRLVTKTEFARHAGVSSPAITKACRNGLAAAMEGDRINLDHPAAQKYISTRTLKSGKTEPRRPAVGAPTDQPNPLNVGPADPTDTGETDSDDGTDSDGAPTGTPDPKRVRVRTQEYMLGVDDIADMTVREIYAKFGTVSGFKDWIYSLKQNEMVREKNLRNAAREGELISRAFVEQHMLSMIEATLKRLLRDAPKTVTARLFALAKSGRTVEEGEALFRDALSKHLQHVKSNTLRALNGETTASKPD